MNNVRFLHLGWVIAAAFIGISVAGGFQDPTSKIGVVDITKVIDSSDFGKANNETFQKMKTTREGILEFIDTYRVLTIDQAQRIRDLSLKPNPTPNDTAELERIKAEVVRDSKRSTELATKQTLTPEERTLMEEYARRSQTMNDVASRWFRELLGEMEGWATEQKLKGIERARASIQEVAKTQGYNVVFEVGIAPFGANDLTDAALKTMNAKK